MIDIRTTHPNGGLQTTTSGSSFPGLPGMSGGDISGDMGFFRDYAMRALNLKEQMARQRMAEESAAAQAAAEDRARGISEHSQDRAAQQREMAAAPNRGFQFTHS